MKSLITLVCLVLLAHTARANPFFAMDTSYRRPGLSRAQQLDLVKELGFAGVSEDVRSAEQTKTQVADIESRGLKLFAIYAPAKVAADGTVSVADDLPAVMDALKGHGTIVWLHIGGKGPAIDSLSDSTPAVTSLRKLADEAAARDLRIAIYPHFGEWTAHFGDATKLAKRVNHDAFGVTFNLCHCLATGDEKHIPELIAAAGPKLFIATIDGADSGVAGADWHRLIQPLGSGTFDTKIVLNALAQIDFAGPVGFQGYGINRDARSILQPTIKAWQKLETEK